MNIIGRNINYKQKLRLFANRILMEQTFEVVADNKLIEQDSY